MLRFLKSCQLFLAKNVKFLAKNGRPDKLHITNNTPIDDDWTEVTQADFDSFCISSDYQTQLRNGPKTTPPSIAAHPSNPFPPLSKFSPADIFRRGIKHDSSLFPTLKNEKLNDSWHRSFTTQAQAQDVSEVLDVAYNSNNDEECDFFQEKQIILFMLIWRPKYSLTMVKAFFRKHENEFDAQAVYKKLVDHHLCSTKSYD